MATQYTSLLGLALPVTGELSGSWGDTVNTAITSLLDSAVSGTTTLSTDADVTLSTTSGVANEARQAILLWTAGGTVTRNITAPAQSKAYFVVNRTSGTQAIVIRGAGPTTGVTVLAGTQSLVVWNGLDFVEVASGNVDGPATSTDNAIARFDGTTGKLIQNSVVTIADTTGNMAGVGTLGVGGALTYGGVTLNNAVTGTGNMVLSTSPTLTTPALGTPSALVGTNITGTASGLTAGNVTTNANLTGAVTSVGNATSLGSFTSAQLAGALTDETGSGSAVFATSPTFVTPALGTPASGVVTNLTGTASININGTVGATTANTGNFTTLTTSSTVTLNGGVASGVAYLNGSKVLTTGSALTFDGTNFNVIRAVATDQYMSLYADGTGPTFKFFGGAAGKVAGITADSASSQMLFTNEGNKPFVYQINGTEQMRLTSTGLELKQSQLIGYSSYAGIGTNGLAVAGNVGIGTSSPVGRLESVGGTGAGFSGWFRTGDATAANNAGGGFYNTSSATATSRSAIMALDADGANLSGGDYFIIQKNGNSGTADILQYSNAAIRFGANYTNRAAIDLTLDSSGNLGLGVTPSAWGGPFKVMQLGINGTYIAGRNNAAQMNIGTNSYFDGSNFIYSSDGAATRISIDSGEYRFNTAPSGTAGDAISFTQALTLDASGNLLVGRTSPITGWGKVVSLQGVSNAAYEVTDGTVVTNLVAAAGAFGIVGTQTDHPLLFRTNGAERARIDSSGNLGIGTSSPAAKLDVNNGANSEMRVSTSGSGFLQVGQFTNGAFIGTSSTDATAGILRLGTGGSERARIDSSGNLLVGTTSASISNTSGARFIDAGRTLNIVNTTATNPSIVTNQVGFGGTTVSFRLTNIEKGYIETSSTSVAYVTSSDYRLKESIAPMQGALARVAALKPVTYKWKIDGSDGEGFIAHELQEVCPDCVTGEKDAVDSKGKPKYQGIDTSFLVATLTAAIQEQQALITALTARITTLESN